jgi:hypothetical protein
VAGLKQKLLVLLDKTATDDRLIAALKAEVAAMKKAKAATSSEGQGGNSQ